MLQRYEIANISQLYFTPTVVRMSAEEAPFPIKRAATIRSS